MDDSIDWKGILITISIVIFLIWLMPKPKPGDAIPLTPPESLYAPRGAVQIIR